MNWFYALNNAQQGPVSEDDLRALVRSGTIQATTQIWKEGMSDWKTLAEARPDLASPAAIMGAHPSIKDLNVQAMREGALTSIHSGPLEYAGFWIRFAAKLIDGIAMWIVQFIIQIVFTGIAAVAISTSSSEPPPVALVGFIIFYVFLCILIQALYCGIMVGKYGATLGKMACGIKVVMPDGSPVSMARAFGRYFAELLSGITLLIGYILAAFDEEKRSLHDHVASTRVIKKR